MRKSNLLAIRYLLPRMNVGGAERHVIRLASGLRQRGHDAAIVSVFEEGDLAGEIRSEKIPYSYLKAAGNWGPGTFFGIMNWIRRNPFDILHTYLFGFHFFAGLPARLTKVPVILSSRREIASWRKLRHRWLEDIGNHFADRVVSCSRAVERWTRENENLASGRILTIYNGVDIRRFDPARDGSSVRREFGIPEKVPLIGTVANFSVEKGYPYLLEAVSRILEKRPEAWFLFVGRGPLVGEMKRKARQISRSQQIVFAGLRPDVPDILATMDIFVLASVVEGFPNVLLEAMAMAKPVAATAAGGIPELICAGEDGLLVPPKDARALAEAVLKLLGDPEGARALGLRAAEKIRRDFTLERMIDDYENLYLSLVKPS